MYHDFFGLDDSPFKITPNLNLFYAGGQRGAVLDALLYAVSSGEGIIKVVGEVGTGKTMLCRMLEEHLPDNVETIYLANPSIPQDEILYAIADELGLDLHNLRSTQMLRALQEYLIEKYSLGKYVVLFIDEAQAMPVGTFEEIRLLSNLETGDRKLLQMVLFGQPELDDHLKSPKIRQLRERITHSFYLSPFDGKQIQEYLSFRLRAVGYRGPDLFSPRTVRLIARASRGLVRRVNIMADKSLLAAFAENTHDIKPAHIQAAIRDSGFHPPFSLWKTIAILTLLTIGAASVYLFQLRHSVMASLNTLPAAHAKKESRENEVFPVTAEKKPAIVSSLKCLIADMIPSIKKTTP
jgi:MSHA biogenesis protein MshM